MFSDRLLDADADNVATGECRSLAEPCVWTCETSRRLGELPDIDHAYELCAAPDGQGLRHVAQARSPVTGRTLAVWSTEPVLQVYTAGQLGSGATPDIGKQGVRHRPRAGLCLEPQQYPNAMNCPAFPLNRVAPGRPYRAQTRYRFGVMP